MSILHFNRTLIQSDISLRTSVCSFCPYGCQYKYFVVGSSTQSVSIQIYYLFSRYMVKAGNHNLERDERSQQDIHPEKFFVHRDYVVRKFVNSALLCELCAFQKRMRAIWQSPQNTVS